ncbi:MAG: ECF RNA polymerase sigma factor SigK [Aquihabitans sp.]
MPRTPRHLRSVEPAGSVDIDELLRRVASGDRRAFTQLFDQLMPIVLGLCRRVLRDPDQAEEVGQEVMLQVWRTAPTWPDDGRSAKAWVAMLAHRRSVDRVRSEQAERDRQQPGQNKMVTVGSSDPVAEEAAGRAETQLVREALGSLTDLQRQTVELAYFEGHTYREVAEKLDLPLGTVKTRIRDGLIRLRESMDAGSPGLATTSPKEGER